MRMRYRPARADSVILSNQTAFALCDSLLQMTRFWIIELPEPELREIRNALDSLLVRTDQVLDLMEGEICLEFGSLRVDSSELLAYDPSLSNVFFFPSDIRHPPGAEDFGAVVIPSTVASDTNDTAESDIGEQESLDSDVSEADVGEFHSTFSSRCPGAANQISVPAAALPPAPASTPVRSPTPAPEPAPTALKYHGRHPLIVSSRENVGLPDYAYHPHFVRPGTSRN